MVCTSTGDNFELRSYSYFDWLIEQQAVLFLLLESPHQKATTATNQQPSEAIGRQQIHQYHSQNLLLARDKTTLTNL